MKNKFLLIGVLVLILFLGGAGVLYKNLSDKYIPGNPSESQSSEGSKDDETEKVYAPDFTVINANKEDVKLSSLKGKYVVINFWASWCGPCKSEFPHFDDAYKKYKDEVEFMMVNLTDGAQETFDRAKKFIDDSGYVFPVYFDTTMEAASTYGIRSIPLTLFINKEGIIVNGRKGAMSKEVLEGYIESLLKN